MKEPQMKNSKSCAPPIPTREEFHSQWGGEIMQADFDTAKPNPLRLKYLHTAYLLNEKHKKGKENAGSVYSCETSY